MCYYVAGSDVGTAAGGVQVSPDVRGKQIRADFEAGSDGDLNGRALRAYGGGSLFLPIGQSKVLS